MIDILRVAASQINHSHQFRRHAYSHTQAHCILCFRISMPISLIIHFRLHAQNRRKKEKKALILSMVCTLSIVVASKSAQKKKIYSALFFLLTSHPIINIKKQKKMAWIEIGRTSQPTTTRDNKCVCFSSKKNSKNIVRSYLISHGNRR